MLFGRGENAQSRGVSSISSGLGIQFFSEPADIFWLVIDHWEHPAKKEQVARL